MTHELRIKIASLLISAYGFFVLANAFIYYFVLLPGETDIFRGIIRAAGAFIIAYYLYKRNKFAYWVALGGSGLIAALGIISVVLLSSVTVDPAVFINLIPVVILISAFILLLPKQVRSEFK